MQRISAEHAEDLVISYRANNLLIHDKMVRSFAGTEPALQSLQDLGLRLAVVTSKRNSLAERGLGIFGLERHFELLIGADDTELHKPHPAPLLLAAKRLGLSPADCAYVGDSPYDMQAARAAGMPAIAALWGMFERQRLLGAGAEYEAHTMAELPAVIAAVIAGS
jgi:pyrophosphatase PpaX